MWSDPDTWGGQLPSEGEDVVIPATAHIILDQNTPDLAGLTIHGVLEFDRQNLFLTADWILVMGELRIGSSAQPFTQQAVITLNAQNSSENIMNMGTRGIMVMGGQLSLHGAPPQVLWTKLNAHATAGNNAASLSETADWQTGDEIVIGPTDFFEAGGGTSVSQRLTIAQVDGSQLIFDQALNAYRWGLMQYATNNGMSLNNVNPVSPPAGPGSTPTELDQRAPVGNLTRNIVIQAPDDVLWNNQGFGCHVMIMNANSGYGDPGIVQMNGVEIRRAGQRGNLGRYPIHCHLLSSSITEILPDVQDQYIRNSVINSSANRGIVLHGTNGMIVRDNIVFDIRGHGIFTEDGVERRNIIDGNLVLHVRNPAPGYALKNHEAGLSQNGGRGSSGFWISNPDNILTNNTAADCGTNGFWLAFPEHPWGLHIDYPMIPNRIRFGVFDNNTAHSNRLEGIMLDFVEIDEVGNVYPRQYMSTTDGQNPSWPWSTLRRFQLERYKTWKNGAHGIWDRGVWADNWEVVSADNCGRYFAGSGADGLIERSLVVGTSLNHLMNGTDRPGWTGEVYPAAFATYHSAFDIRDNIVVNFPEQANTMSGAFATEDYYLRPVEKGQIRNTDNLLIQSHPGVKLAAPYSYFVLAGALWDPHGTWGGSAGEWLVYDDPFYTYGQSPAAVPPGSVSGGVLVNGPFYGFNEFVVNQENQRWDDLMEIQVDRLDQNFNVIGNLSVDQAQPGWALAHMRHFAAHPDGYYSLEFPGYNEVNDLGISVSNMDNVDDRLVIGVEYSGNYAIEQVYTSSYYNYMDPGHTAAGSYAYKHVYTPVGNLQDVLNSSGESYWHDSTNDRVWIKLQGGIQQTWNPDDYPAFSDEQLYWLFYLRIFGSEVDCPDIGNPCDDGDVCTTGDLIQADCSCLGTLEDSDGDGVCDTQDQCPGLEPGMPCDDGDVCTASDVVQADCSCVGTFADTDGDGICDTEDLCPGPEPGTDCDDGDVCTIDDVIMTDCGCSGTYVDNDGDGWCMYEDPDDNDPCAPDQNVGGCNPCNILDQEDFESGLGNWNDGGSDCGLSGSYPESGNYSVLIRDNSGEGSSVISDQFNLQGEQEVTIDFSYYPYSMENGEDFFLELSTNGGGSFSIVRNWISGIDFVNGQRYYESVAVTSNAFSSTTVFRFRCDASSNTDRIFLDNIVINTCNISCDNGQPCDDGDTCTVNDSYDSACNCVGLFQDADGDGICDSEDQCPTIDDGLIGLPCDDGDICTVQDSYDSTCQCIGEYQDSDGDVICDTEDQCPFLNDSLIGQPCDDGDECTIQDEYNLSCNCAGILQDSDGDGICDFEDQCPSMDDQLIGQSCDDSDACTAVDIYNANCQCAGQYADQDGDGYCVGEDPDDSDGCVPDPDSGLCNPCGGGETEDFESGYGIWNDGGSDCGRVSSNANSGSYSILLRDNSSGSDLYSNTLDLSAVEEVIIEFSYYPVSMESGERFVFEVSYNGGNSFQESRQWRSGIEFSNNQRYQESIQISGISFTGETVFRFRCDASSNADQVYLDDISISTCQGQFNQLESRGLPEPQDNILQLSTDIFHIFPNPASHEFSLRWDGIMQDLNPSLIVRDILGNLVFYRRSIEPENNRYKISLESWENGIYIVTVTGRSGKSQTAKLLIMK